MTLDEVETPALLLDHELLARNVARMRDHLQRLAVPLRPHTKTAKSMDVVGLALAGQPGGVTVSTLREAEYFFERGVRDILYAVAIAPAKLARVAAMIRRGAGITVILDSIVTALAVGQAAAAERVTYPVLIEVDADGHRSGIRPDSPALIELGRMLAAAPGVALRGVMTHAGGSYNCRSVECLRVMAACERAGAVAAANRLRAAGLPVSVVSVGSTPTALFAEDLGGVTEVRAGVYMFQDLVMAGLGVCSVADIALSVLVTVIGHQAERGWIVTDGGWTALSRDRGTASQPVDQGYGLVCDVHGRVTADDLIVVSTNQEHGIIARRDGGVIDAGRYPMGTLLRVLPNHACATAAQYGEYRVVARGRPDVRDTWPRINDW